ncbi:MULTISPECIES: hypothetical protein [Paraburkholderia]|jgi:hypothetical protein|uniref:hypothetical protein n=1 Tax=Paraburkholderia TaxID=1822464 RepID=UPI0015C57361|nr:MULTISPECIES: hypothetical protein [Paraburkholderia]MCX4171468.1 hypothetical protein [Paraburkholderia madseniana]MDQ6459479.1 hypothetical protein [Paraburkholderia madseniana]NPT63058.1 hypothetical protein [Paraburkholderia madseniana]
MENEVAMIAVITSESHISRRSRVLSLQSCTGWDTESAAANDTSTDAATINNTCHSSPANMKASVLFVDASLNALPIS